MLFYMLLHTVSWEGSSSYSFDVPMRLCYKLKRKIFRLLTYIGDIETQNNSAYSHPPPATHSLSISTNTITFTQEGTEPIVLYEEIML